MWVRNGHTLQYQSILYAQAAFCSTFVDLDLALMRMCAALVVDVRWMLLTVLDRCVCHAGLL